MAQGELEPDGVAACRHELVLLEVTRIVRSTEPSYTLTPHTVLSGLIGSSVLGEASLEEIERALVELARRGLVEKRSHYYFHDDLPGDRLLPDEEAKAFRGEPFVHDGSPGDPGRLYIVFVPTQPADVQVLRESLSPALRETAASFEAYCQAMGRSPKSVAEEISIIRSKRIWKNA